MDVLITTLNYQEIIPVRAISVLQNSHVQYHYDIITTATTRFLQNRALSINCVDVALVRDCTTV